MGKNAKSVALIGLKTIFEIFKYAKKTHLAVGFH